MQPPRFLPGCAVRASRMFRLSPPELASANDVSHQYCTDRGFKLTESEAGWLKAKRGSWLGNWTSFDMADLRTQLNICLGTSGDVLCEMMVNGAGQIITTYNRAYWAFELALFEVSLRGRGDEIKPAWQEFRKQGRRDAVRWSLSIGKNAGLSQGTLELFERFGARLEDVQPFGVK